MSTGSVLAPENFDFVYEKIKSDLQLVCRLSPLSLALSPHTTPLPLSPLDAQVFGLTLAAVIVLLLPLDVGNRFNPIFNMALMWQVFFIIVAVMVIIVIPFAIFYYENDEDEAGTQLAGALKMEAITFVVAAIVIGLMYAFLSTAEPPIEQLSTKGLQPGLPGSDYNQFYGAGRTGGAGFALACLDTGGGKSYHEPASFCHREMSILKINVSFPIYLIGLISVVGWFFFVLFGGIGLVALPIDLILTFVHRPTPISLQEFANRKISLHQRAVSLIEIGKGFEKEMMGRRDAKYRKVYNKFRTAVYHLENEFENLRIAFKDKGGSPIKYWSIGFLGFIAAIISLLWFLHIIIFMTIKPAPTPFLNDLFKSSESSFALFGTILYGVFSFYLLWCVIKGNMKFGLRFFWIAIHPMRLGNTLMNSFLFNVSLVLLCSVAVVQFCAQAFSVYARLTDVSMIFGVQIRYLMGLKYFWLFYLYALLGMIGLCAIYFLLCPTDKSKHADLQEDFEDILQGRGKQKSLKKKRFWNK
eukprot:TRINITY_DN13466_c0_g2_i5.p1 TRINITY_DN13466_c0_g2~~TRINITY_DN13466_c0_g2_i5.p1  ORF type:complete len:560 (-),score=152.78 TRINITY_DN13466_c0_g2_i5:3659-5239(-)